MSRSSKSSSSKSSSRRRSHRKSHLHHDPAQRQSDNANNLNHAPSQPIPTPRPHRQIYHLTNPQTHPLLTDIAHLFLTQFGPSPFEIAFSFTHIALDAHWGMSQMPPDFNDRTSFIETRVIHIDLPPSFAKPGDFVRDLQICLAKHSVEDSAIELHRTCDGRRVSMWFPPVIEQGLIGAYMGPMNATTRAVYSDVVERDAFNVLKAVIRVLKDVRDIVRTTTLPGQKLEEEMLIRLREWLAVLPSLVRMLAFHLRRRSHGLSTGEMGGLLRRLGIERLSEVSEMTVEVLGRCWEFARGLEVGQLVLIMEGLFRARRSMGIDLRMVRCDAVELERYEALRWAFEREGVWDRVRCG